MVAIRLNYSKRTAQTVDPQLEQNFQLLAHIWVSGKANDSLYQIMEDPLHRTVAE